MKDNGIQWETMGDNGGQGGESGDKGETRPREGGHTIQHKRQDNGRQGEARPYKADTPSNTGTPGKAMGKKGKQDLGKADRPSNKRKQEDNKGRQGETRPPAGGHAIQHLRGDNGRQWKQWETMGDKGRHGETTRDKAHPTREQEGVITMGDKGRQDPREGGHTIQQRETRRGTFSLRTRHTGSAGSPRPAEAAASTPLPFRLPWMMCIWGFPTLDSNKSC